MILCFTLIMKIFNYSYTYVPLEVTTMQDSSKGTETIVSFSLQNKHILHRAKGGHLSINKNKISNNINEKILSNCKHSCHQKNFL